MKCDKLQAYKGDVTIPVYGTIADADVYLKDKADEALSEKDHEIARLNTEIKEAVKTMKSQDVEIMELKKKLENVQATAYADSVDAGMRERRLKRALRLARAERYKMREFIAREEGNLCNQMSWSQFLRKRTYSQWVDQLLRIANLANKLQDKCLKKAEEYK